MRPPKLVVSQNQNTHIRPKLTFSNIWKHYNARCCLRECTWNVPFAQFRKWHSQYSAMSSAQASQFIKQKLSSASPSSTLRRLTFVCDRHTLCQNGFILAYGF